jgi:hypothetical protein
VDQKEDMRTQGQGAGAGGGFRLGSSRQGDARACGSRTTGGGGAVQHPSDDFIDSLILNLIYKKSRLKGLSDPYSYQIFTNYALHQILFCKNKTE